MSILDSKQPVSFKEAIEQLRISAGGNATVAALTSPLDGGDSHGPEESRGGDMAEMAMRIVGVKRQDGVVNQLGDILAGLGIHKMVPMAMSASEASISIALYAGDGVVAKITTHRFLNRELRPSSFVGASVCLPEVLPPAFSQNIGDFSVELYPWIDRKNVNNSHLDKVKKNLADSNLRFIDGDARTDNIGLLPGPEKRAVVLDADAVELVEGQSIPTENIHRWNIEVLQHLGRFYSADPKKLVSSEPNFEEKFSPLVSEGSEKIVGRSWIQRNGGSGHPTF